MSSNGLNNAGLKLLDACLNDHSYAKYLLGSKRAEDLDIRTKINWRDLESGNCILHFVVYSDLDTTVELLLNHGADPNNRNKVNLDIFIVIFLLPFLFLSLFFLYYYDYYFNGFF